ncbi:Peptidase M23 [Tenacibaculum litopenaei]|jgi:septal ring factor EnvC (AmiA/AmiB activator)|uniref:murein hydrolase activator EnvC family protein n=1 Tax=Tenacibaculum litopenaei TaxID=396016 RepID=UPI003895133A
MKKALHIFVFISALCFTVLAQAQSQRELEKKRNKLKKEIKQVNELLFKTKKKKSNALEDLKDLNQKISVRERLIETIEMESTELENTIAKNTTKLEGYEKDLANLKKDYSEMVVKTHKSKSMQSKTMFLLSSQSFYQAYKRVKYMQQYNEFRKKQGEAILARAEAIKKLNDSLSRQKNIKERLITEEKEQKDEIENDRKDQEKLITTIKKQESKYKNSLLKKQAAERKIQARIDRLIREAIARSNRKKKKAKGSKKSKKSAEFTLNAAEKKLLANFEQNKGNLPWPVKGIITRKYGIQPHPTFSGITINSTGLHIATKANTAAKSIFTGKVLAIQKNADGKKSVLVQHGNYISAYNNLESVYVKKGEAVKTGQKLGKVFTDRVTGKTKLGFVLFKNTVRLNPAEWIQ